MKLPWIKNPKTDLPDTMLTLAISAFIICAIKFLLHGITLTIDTYSLTFGSLDGGIIAALLTPTIGAYVARRYTDTIDKKEEEKHE